MLFIVSTDLPAVSGLNPHIDTVKVRAIVKRWLDSPAAWFADEYITISLSDDIEGVI